MNIFMQKAKENAENGLKSNKGGPFGAVIVDEKGNIIANGYNEVISKNDPTAHAEISAIRNACKFIKSYDLSSYTLYTSCEPCPMCLSAIIWSNIKKVYYGCSKEDASEIGFRDEIIYDFLKNENKDLLTLNQIDRNECIELFKKYKQNDGIIY